MQNKKGIAVYSKHSVAKAVLKNVAHCIYKLPKISLKKCPKENYIKNITS